MKRSRKGRDNHFFRHGGYCGWQDYRYGSSAKVTLPILSSRERKEAVEKTIPILDNFSLSPFQNEAAVRHGIRGAFCLQSYDWHRADAEAAAIVAEGLRRNGASRPSWAEGQRDYVEGRENCAHCRKPIEEDMLGKTRFCSSICARSAIERWSFHERRWADERYSQAVRAVLLFKVPKRPCKHCGTEFRPRDSSSTGNYCSNKCRGLSQRLSEKECHACNKPFHPKERTQLYCSEACSKTRFGKRFPIGICDCCGNELPLERYGKLYCGSACGRLARSIKSGRKKAINPSVFDFVFRMAA